MKLKRKRLIGIVLGLALVLGMMLAMTVTSHAETEYYSVYVGGKQVTSANALDVLGDGTVSYTPATYTLKLSGAHINAGFETAENATGIESHDIDHLTIELDPGTYNSINIRSEGKTAIGILASAQKVTFKGAGSLSIGADICVNANNVDVEEGTINFIGTSSAFAPQTKVKNAIAGTGLTYIDQVPVWDPIATSSEGRQLADYKQVWFPTYAGLIPQSIDDDTALAGKVVKFNGYDWYIIKDNSTEADDGTVTLLANESFGSSKFHDSSNAYSTSTIRNTLYNMTASGSFAGVKDAIEDTDLTDVSVTGAKLYLLSTTEANNVPENVRKFSANWWLRSPGHYDYYAAFVDGEYGFVNDYGLDVVLQFGVRPALQLDLSAVGFDPETMTFQAVPSVVEYPLWVGGTQVTEENASDVFGDGTVSFAPAAADDPETIDEDESAPATLTLSGYSYEGEGYSYEDGTITIHSAIMYSGEDPLTVELEDENSITCTTEEADSWTYGFLSNSDESVNIEGTGSITVTGRDQGIHTKGDLNINSGSVTVSQEQGTGFEVIGNMVIGENAGTIISETSDDNDFHSVAVLGDEGLTVNGGIVQITNEGTDAIAITTKDGPVTIGENAKSFIAAGTAAAFENDVIVKNAIAGTGWDNAQGTGKGTPIKASSDGQTFEFKRVQLLPPDPAEVVTEQIRALPAFNKIRTADEEAILAARAAYEALTDEEKAEVKLSVIRRLKSAETALAAAKKAEERKAKRKIAEQLADENYVSVRDKRAEDAVKAKEDIKEKIDPIKTRSRQLQEVLDDIDKSARAVADNIKTTASKISGTTKRLIKQAISIIRRWIR